VGDPVPGEKEEPTGRDVVASAAPDTLDGPEALRVEPLSPAQVRERAAAFARYRTAHLGPVVDAVLAQVAESTAALLCRVILTCPYATRAQLPELVQAFAAPVVADGGWLLGFTERGARSEALHCQALVLVPTAEATREARLRVPDALARVWVKLSGAPLSADLHRIAKAVSGARARLQRGSLDELRASVGRILAYDTKPNTRGWFRSVDDLVTHGAPSSIVIAARTLLLGAEPVEAPRRDASAPSARTAGTSAPICVVCGGAAMPRAKTCSPRCRQQHSRVCRLRQLLVDDLDCRHGRRGTESEDVVAELRDDEVRAAAARRGLQLPRSGAAQGPDRRRAPPTPPAASASTGAAAALGSVTPPAETSLGSAGSVARELSQLVAADDQKGDEL
jgi:hypothetical protein